MSRHRRTLYADALQALLNGDMAKAAIRRDFELLREIARLAQSDAPLDLAVTDPALFASWRAAVTRYHVAGWTHMTPNRVDQIATEVGNPEDGLALAPVEPDLTRGS